MNGAARAGRGGRVACARGSVATVEARDRERASRHTSWVDARSGLERAVRRGWRRGPGPLLRAAGAAYGAGVSVRNWLYDSGALPVREASIPVIGVGGLTVGGSGKTPLAATLAGWLADNGWRVGVVARLADEAAVHRRLEPRARVGVGREYGSVVEELAREGCEVALLDSGFQHRRLARAFDVVAVSADAWERDPPRRLPAGPYREGLEALCRADAAVVVRREAHVGARDDLLGHVGTLWPGLPLASCRLRPGSPAVANRSAEGTAPEPAVATAALAHPETFLRQAQARFPGVRVLRSYPDHYPFPPAAVAALALEAGARGLVCTLKDAVKLEARLPTGTPLWYVPDVLEWESGEGALRALLRGVAGSRAGSRSERCA